MWAGGVWLNSAGFELEALFGSLAPLSNASLHQRMKDASHAVTVKPDVEDEGVGRGRSGWRELRPGERGIPVWPGAEETVIAASQTELSALY